MDVSLFTRGSLVYTTASSYIPTTLTAPHSVAAGHVVEINCQEITTCAWPIPVCVNTGYIACSIGESYP